MKFLVQSYKILAQWKDSGNAGLTKEKQVGIFFSYHNKIIIFPSAATG